MRYRFVNTAGYPARIAYETVRLLLHDCGAVKVFFCLKISFMHCKIEKRE